MRFNLSKMPTKKRGIYVTSINGNQGPLAEEATPIHKYLHNATSRGVTTRLLGALEPKGTSIRISIIDFVSLVDDMYRRLYK